MIPEPKWSNSYLLNKASSLAATKQSQYLSKKALKDKSGVRKALA